MKRERDEDLPCHDPVLAQLDFLINGPPQGPRPEAPPAPAPAPALPPAPPPAPIVPQDPVLVQLDALINGAPPVPSAAPAASEEAADDVRAGPPGILREYGGVKGWMRRHCSSTSPSRSTPPPRACTNSPSPQ